MIKYINYMYQYRIDQTYYMYQDSISLIKDINYMYQDSIDQRY